MVTPYLYVFPLGSGALQSISGPPSSQESLITTARFWYPLSPHVTPGRIAGYVPPDIPRELNVRFVASDVCNSAYTPLCAVQLRTWKVIDLCLTPDESMSKGDLRYEQGGAQRPVTWRWPFPQNSSCQSTAY